MNRAQVMQGGVSHWAIISVSFFRLQWNCLYWSPMEQVFLATIGGFHSIYSLGNWRALHHHAAYWLVNIHITWHFCPPVSMVKMLWNPSIDRWLQSFLYRISAPGTSSSYHSGEVAVQFTHRKTVHAQQNSCTVQLHHSTGQGGEKQTTRPLGKFCSLLSRSLSPTPLTRHQCGLS